jgi:hypothetical protein
MSEHSDSQSHKESEQALNNQIKDNFAPIINSFSSSELSPIFNNLY